MYRRTPPSRKEDPPPPSTDSNSLPSLVAFTMTMDISMTPSIKTTPPLPSYASIAKKATMPPKEKTPTPTISITTTEERCNILNNCITTLLQQHREATQTLKQQFHHLMETSVTGKLLAETSMKTSS